MIRRDSEERGGMDQEEAGGTRKGLARASLGALGIVYGDLGTSPLYTLQTVVSDAGSKATIPDILGSVSLLVWAVLFIVTFKYATLVMRADNNGEGGILALLSLIGARFGRTPWSRATLLTSAGLFGAALLYGDGVITPSISVLSALEGVGVATDALKPFVLPAAIAILFGLFAAQPFGTARIGAVFGPVMLIWFVAIGAIGLWNTASHPAVLRALDPGLGLAFLMRKGWSSMLILGGVFLAVTGAEALYADMSHVGRRAVRVAWGAIVLPSLMLSYLGQAAAMTAGGVHGGNPFFATVPRPLVLPLVALATLATIIASQAIITGTFTLTRQAMQLGWFPGLNIRQTSDTEYGQIYVPVVNWLMMIATIAIALAFRSSDALSGAYGTAVSTTMLMTTLLIFDVMRARWHWNLALASAVAALLLVVDLAFFAANILKIGAGGYVPLSIGIGVFTVMTTWHRGVELVRAGLAPLGERSDEVLAKLRDGSLLRVPGAAVFLSRSESPIPPIVARHVATFGSLPEKIVVLAVHFEDTPRIPPSERVIVSPVLDCLWQVRVRFGFVEIPNLMLALAEAREKGVDVDPAEVTFFAGHDDITADRRSPRMSAWRRLLFGFTYRNAVRASDRFALPREHLVEIGHQVEI